MDRFVFVADKDVIDRLTALGTPEDVRHNVMSVSKGDFFKEDGWLVYLKWMVSLGVFDYALDMETRNEFDTGMPGVSYDDLCDYQAEFEKEHGVCDGDANDAEVIAYQLALLQYCADRVNGIR